MTATVNASDRILTTSKRDAGEGSTQRFLRRPGVAHLQATLERYGHRLGNQFAAAITYFLILALVPILMFAFSALGFFLEVVRPDLMDVVSEQISETGGSADIAQMLQQFLSGWRGVGIVAIVSALYTAQGFMGNLKDAIRSQLSDDGVQKDQDGFVPRVVNNTLTLLIVLVGAGLAISLTIVSSSLRSVIVRWLELPGWMDPVFQLVPLVVSAATFWLLLFLVFTLLPSSPIPRRTKAKGALVGAIALAVIVRFATLLIDLFSGSPAASVFGPIIAIMLSLNIVARIILMVAAWMGTAGDDSMFHTVAEAPAGEHPVRRTADDGPRDTVVAFATASALIALTLVGFNRFQSTDRRTERTH